MAKVIILNYPCTTIEWAYIPEGLCKDCEDVAEHAQTIEDYITKDLGYSIDEINYMLVDNECPVYQWGADSDHPSFVI